uniref:Uncharacterized protein n=1 Tax=Rhizophora mucronata TaxID=61149 RepID=A0A2P2QIV1_RHIMU
MLPNGATIGHLSDHPLFSMVS